MARNLRREAFIREYLVDFNATQAAVRAGYSPKTAYAQGHRLLKDADVSRQIAEKASDRAKAADITAQWVLEKLKDLLEKPTLSDRNRLHALELVGKHLAVNAWRENVRTTQVTELVVRDFTGGVRPNGHDDSAEEGGRLNGGT